MLSQEDSSENRISLNKDDLISLISCPITTQIFFDPVSINNCSHTFEHEAISTWCDSHHNPLCPVCRAPILGLLPAIVVNGVVELTLANHPTLQNQRYFKLEYLKSALHNNEIAKLDKLLNMLKTSEYLNRASEESDYEDINALMVLSMFPEIIIRDRQLKQAITPQGLNLISKMGMSPLHWLLATTRGLALFVQDNELRAKISSEGLNTIAKEEGIKGLSGLYWLTKTLAGRDLLARDDVLRAKITRVGLNSIRAAGSHKGASALYWLAKKPEGQAILFKDKRLCALIEKETLTSIVVDDNKQTALQHLKHTTLGRNILKNLTHLRDPIGLGKENSNRLFHHHAQKPVDRQYNREEKICTIL